MGRVRVHVKPSDDELKQLRFVASVLRTSPEEFLKSVITTHYNAVVEMIDKGVLQGVTRATDPKTSPTEGADPSDYRGPSGERLEHADEPEPDQDRGPTPEG